MSPLPRESRAARFGAPVLVGAAFLGLWQAVVVLFDIPVYLVPSPMVIARTLIDDHALLLASLWVTLKITFAAFVAAVILGTALAFLFVQSRWVERSLFPYAVLLQVTPIVAIAPLIIIWVDKLGGGDVSVALTICATIVALFPVISNTTLGLRSVNPGLADLFRMNKATRWQVLLRLRIPSALPYFFGGLRISSGLALIGAVVAEFVAGTGGSAAGLAYQILVSGFQLNVPRLFAALFLITLTGVVLFAMMSWLSRLALGGWHESEIGGDH